MLSPAGRTGGRPSSLVAAAAGGELHGPPRASQLLRDALRGGWARPEPWGGAGDEASPRSLADAPRELSEGDEVGLVEQAARGERARVARGEDHRRVGEQVEGGGPHFVEEVDLGRNGPWLGGAGEGPRFGGSGGRRGRGRVGSCCEVRRRAEGRPRPWPRGQRTLLECPVGTGPRSRWVQDPAGGGTEASGVQEERACCCRPSAVASNFAYRRRSPSSCAYACTVSSCAKASPAYETAAAPAAAARRLIRRSVRCAREARSAIGGTTSSVRAVSCGRRGGGGRGRSREVKCGR